MSANPRAWYTMPGDADTVAPEDFDNSFYPHYYPDPFISYSGQPTAPTQIAADRAAGKTCIRMLGDSTIAASGICQQIESLLQGKGWNAAVHNAGVIAANANIMLSTMVHRVMDSRPDITIVVSGGIDVLSPLQFDPRPGYPHIQALKEVMFEHFHDPARTSVWLDKPPKRGYCARGWYALRIRLRDRFVSARSLLPLCFHLFGQDVGLFSQGLEK